MQGASAVPGGELAGGKSIRGKSLSNLHLVLIGIALVAALAVITASLRMTERAIDRAVAQREASARFLAEELAVLRLMAMSSESPVPARLYLGIEECFRRNTPLPFTSEQEPAARHLIATCAQMEVGRLHAQGGRGLADKGQAILKELSLIR